MAELVKEGFKITIIDQWTGELKTPTWTGTDKRMIAKCKKIIDEFADPSIEVTYDKKPGMSVDFNTLKKTIKRVYNVDILEAVVKDEIKAVNEEKKVKVIQGPSGAGKDNKVLEIVAKQMTKTPRIKLKSPDSHLLTCRRCGNGFDSMANLEYITGYRAYSICPKCKFKMPVVKTTPAKMRKEPKIKMAKKARLKARRENGTSTS